MIVFAVGCYTEASVGAGYDADYAAPAPEMEVVTPGVQVVAVDYDYPVFYTDGAYWRYDGGVWYSSHVYNGGWAVSYNVPVGVRGISRPYAYAHYRGNANWGRPAAYRGGPAYRGGGPAWRGGGGGGPVVRDHRAPAAWRPAPARGPIVRDHRH